MTTVSQPATDHLAAEPDCPTAPPDPRGGLASPSFLGLLFTQLLGAMNDNMFRWLAVWIGKDLVPKEYQEVAVSIGLALLVLPFILLAAPAGYLADRFSKRTVIVGCKMAEVIIMILGVATILYGNIYVMFAIIFLMGAHSALFGPSKYGSIPELVRPERISAANGLVGMTTIVAIVLGTVNAGYLYHLTQPLGRGNWWLEAVALVGVAAFGLATSLLIRPLRPADPTQRFPVNWAGQTYRDLKTLAHGRPLLLVAVASALFWSLAGLCQINVEWFASKDLLLAPKDIGPLLAVLAVGVGVGNVLAGIWSASKIELGMVPVGAAGIAMSLLLLWTVPGGGGPPLSAAYLLTCLWLLVLGVSAGMYDVPLQSFLQYRSPEQSRGAILAASNFLTFSGTMIASGVFLLLGTVWGVSGRNIFLFSGLAVVPILVVIVCLVPEYLMRFLLTRLLRTFYRIRVRGVENIPERGGVLLAPNHVTWIDGLLLGLCSPRPLRFVVYIDYINSWWIRWFAQRMGAIPIGSTRKSIAGAIRTAREALKQGEVVCIFPEGGLTRNGQLQAFRPGFLSILEDTDAPVLPVYLDGLWGSIFSFERGRFFWKLPRRLPYPLAITFGQPVSEVDQPYRIRQAVQELGTETVTRRMRHQMILPRRFLRQCRKALFRSKVADSTGVNLTGGRLLAATLVLRRLLRRLVLSHDEENIGLLLPTSVGALLANTALALDRRVAVNLNYTLSSDILNACIRQAGIRHVLTSRRVMERFSLTVDAELVYLEDLRQHVTLCDKAIAALGTWLLPAWALERCLGLTRVHGDELLTLIFTSGSTGQPKGVMLTHRNIGSNVEAVDHLIRLRKEDVLVGILPAFHSFGYTTTLWTVLTLAPKGVYHPNPLEAREVGKLCQEQRGTILVTTPTFVRSYLKRCSREELGTLNVVFTGAEKLSGELASAFEEKFGVRPVEGYGTTELSPVVAGNIPLSRVLNPAQVSSKEGTVGRPIPGVSVKVVDLETGEDLGVDRSGMLLVKGPNVMQGYLGRPELTAEVIREGWYVTGDVAMIDEDGFITITGRESRFSKIGGEMVPHIRVEESLNKALSLDEEEVRIAVSSVPDAKKGERLVVLHTGLEKPPEEICNLLRQAGLPALWIPSPDSFRQIDAIPVLGTGKLDLKRVKRLAEEEFSRRN